MASINPPPPYGQIFVAYGIWNPAPPARKPNSNTPTWISPVDTFKWKRTEDLDPDHVSAMTSQIDSIAKDLDQRDAWENIEFFGKKRPIHDRKDAAKRMTEVLVGVTGYPDWGLETEEFYIILYGIDGDAAFASGGLAIRKIDGEFLRWRKPDPTKEN